MILMPLCNLVQGKETIWKLIIIIIMTIIVTTFDFPRSSKGLFVMKEFKVSNIIIPSRS